MGKTLLIIFMLILFLFSFAIFAIDKTNFSQKQSKQLKGTMENKINKSEEHWKCELTEEQYYITRQKGTEKPFTGKYYNFYEKGIYVCVCCGNELFSSETKYNSGSGWPSFYQAIKSENIIEKVDYSHGMIRMEVQCSKCGAHLGHVFEDGPQPTGLRYCINSASLNFKPDKNDK